MIRRHVRRFISLRPACLLALATLSIVALVATPSLGHAPVGRRDALPTAAERLERPIWLPHCGMQVVEWRSTAELFAETTPSREAIAVIDDTCRATFERYDDFLRTRKLPRLRTRALALPSISLLPGNILLDGKSLRALNDLPSRFDAVAPGCCYWGLYVDALDHLFLRNDPLIETAEGTLEPNPRFVRTLTHEISHVLSARLGVWDVMGYDRKNDEDLAEAFVAFMGMRFPAESSADDLAFHRQRASATLPVIPSTPTHGAPAGIALDQAAHPAASGPAESARSQRQWDGRVERNQRPAHAKGAASSSAAATSQE